MQTRKRTAALAAMATLSIFAATTAVTLSHEHEVSTSALVPHLVGDAFAAWWNGSEAQALYRRWDGHLGELCANPSHRH